MKRPRLGRGLDALLGEADSPGGASAGPATDIAIDRIERGRYQPRLRFDEEALDALAASIRAQGVIQPVVVRAMADGRFELIAGERRWRAAQRAGLAHVPAVVRELTDAAALAVALIENIQREDLTPVEEARALKRLIEEFSLTHEQAAAHVGRSRAAVTNLLRLLTLDAAVLDALNDRLIDMGHARALATLEPPRQRRVLAEILARHLTVRDVERLIARGDTIVAERAETADPDVRALEQELTDRLGSRVRLQSRRGGRGRLVIEYANVDALEGLLSRLR